MSGPLSPPLSRSAAHDALERSSERGLALISNANGNFENAHRWVRDHEFLRPLDALLRQPREGRESHRLFERAAEMVGRQLSNRRQVHQRDTFTEISAQIIRNPLLLEAGQAASSGCSGRYI